MADPTHIPAQEKRDPAGEITRPLTQDPIHPRRALTDARLSRLVEPQPRNRKKSEEDEAA